MARALRLQYPGAVYHVTTRGNERRNIYRDEQDRRRFVEKLAENVEARHVRLYAYVLMSNHYHLLLETPRANLVFFMQQLNGSYSVYFNRRHRRSGHLFGGRYKAKVVEGDEYLLQLTRYIHLNPVKIKRMASLEPAEKRKALRAYRWSSYRGYADIGRREKWMDYGPLSELVGQGQRKKELAYRRYVEAGLAADDPELDEALRRSSKAIGLEGFCRWAEEAYRQLAQKQGQPLDVAMRRVEVPPAPDEVVDAVCRHLGVNEKDLRKRRQVGDARILTMKLLKEEVGLTQREVALQLGLRDGSGVSWTLKELSGRLERERKLKKCYNTLREAIAGNH